MGSLAEMIDFLKLLVESMIGLFRSHAAREAEMAFLRRKLLVSRTRGRCGHGVLQAAVAVGIPCWEQPRPSNEQLARAERMAQCGVIEPTVCKHDSAAFLRNLERIAAGKVVVG